MISRIVSQRTTNDTFKPVQKYNKRAYYHRSKVKKYGDETRLIKNIVNLWTITSTKRVLDPTYESSRRPLTF